LKACLIEEGAGGRSTEEGAGGRSTGEGKGMGIDREIEGEAEALLPGSFIFLASMGAASTILTIRK